MRPRVLLILRTFDLVFVKRDVTKRKISLQLRDPLVGRIAGSIIFKHVSSAEKLSHHCYKVDLYWLDAYLFYIRCFNAML